MAGLFDFLPTSSSGGLFDFLGSILNPQPQATQAVAQAQVPQQPPQPPQMPTQMQPQFGPGQVNGLGGRLSGAIGGFINGGSPIGGLFNAARTLATGEVTDPTAIARGQMVNAYRSLQKDFGLSEPQARMIVNNPKLMTEFFKAAVSPGVTVGPEGTMVQQLPFGRLNVAGTFPVSERGELTNPGGSKSPAFFVKPSLTNPNGRIANPAAGQPGAVPGSYPTVSGVSPNDPTMSISPRTIAQANAPVITEQSPAATAEQKATGEGLAKDYNDIRAKSDAATKKINTLTRMAQLTDSAYQGKGAPGLQYVRSLLATYGLDPGKVPVGEEFQALSAKMVLDASNGSLGNQISNSDRDYLASINPELSQTKEGRRQIIQTQLMLAKRDQDIGKMATAWKNKFDTLDGFSNYVAQWSEQNPLFANRQPLGQQQPSQSAGVPKQNTGQAQSGVIPSPNMPRVGNKTDYDALPSGTQFVGPDGGIWRKP